MQLERLNYTVTLMIFFIVVQFKTDLAIKSFTLIETIVEVL